MKTTKFFAIIFTLVLTLALFSCGVTFSETTHNPETTAPVETTEPVETTAPVETIEPVETTSPVETTEPAESTTEHVCLAQDLRDVPGKHASVCTVCNKVLMKTEACKFVRRSCTDTMVVCTVCGASQNEPPEEHNMKHVSSKSGCWYTEETYSCSKCGMMQTMHGDAAWPRHIWKEETADGKTTFSCTRCSESSTFNSEIGKFSYAEVLEQYKVGDDGVKHDGFTFGYTDWKTENAVDAVTKAKLEVLSHYTFEYDTISVSFDNDSSVWRVDFYTLNVPGGGYSVYIQSTGEICYIICGE